MPVVGAQGADATAARGLAGLLEGAPDLGGVAGGQYLLQLQPQRGGTGSTPTEYEVRVVQDVYLTRYSVLALTTILFFPLLAWLFGWLFERRRWKNSDYSGD